MKKQPISREAREVARATAWANYVRIRDAATKECDAATKKAKADEDRALAAARKARDLSRNKLVAARRQAEENNTTEAEIYNRLEREIEPKTRAAINEATTLRDEKISAAWLAFEVLDVGGRGKPRTGK